MKFSDQILQLRDKQRMSQEELSEGSGISVRTIQRIEKGQVTPRSYTIKRLLEVFNMPLEEFDAEKQQEVSIDAKENLMLNRFIISNILIIIFPIIFQILPGILWKRREWSKRADIVCRKILSFQILWSLGSVFFAMLTHLLIGFFEGQYVVGRSIPTSVIVYIWLCLIDILIVFKIAKGLKNNTSHWGSMIPDLF